MFKLALLAVMSTSSSSKPAINLFPFLLRADSLLDDRDTSIDSLVSLTSFSFSVDYTGTRSHTVYFISGE